MEETSARVKLEEKENIHHSSRTCLVSQRMLSLGSGWQCSSLALLLPKPAPKESKQSNIVARLPALSGAVVCHMSVTAHISSFRKPLCQMSHSLIDIRNLNDSVL